MLIYTHVDRYVYRVYRMIWGLGFKVQTLEAQRFRVVYAAIKYEGFMDSLRGETVK